MLAVLYMLSFVTLFRNILSKILVVDTCATFQFLSYLVFFCYPSFIYVSDFSIIIKVSDVCYFPSFLHYGSVL